MNRIEIEIMQILLKYPLPKRIDMVERIGKKLRQQNSIETNREVNEFKRKSGNNKSSEDYGAFLGK